jgi:hypothetical protein
VVKKSGIGGADFLKSTSVSLASHYSTYFSIIILTPGAGAIGLLVAAVPSEPNWTPPPTMLIKKKKRLKKVLMYLRNGDVPEQTPENVPMDTASQIEGSYTLLAVDGQFVATAVALEARLHFTGFGLAL